MEIDPVHYDVGQSSALQQCVNIEPELVNVSMEDIPDGPLVSAEDQRFYSDEHPNRSFKNTKETSTSANGKLNWNWKKYLSNNLIQSFSSSSNSNQQLCGIF